MKVSKGETTQTVDDQVGKLLIERYGWKKINKGGRPPKKA